MEGSKARPKATLQLQDPTNRVIKLYLHVRIKQFQVHTFNNYCSFHKSYKKTSIINCWI